MKKNIPLIGVLLCFIFQVANANQPDLTSLPQLPAVTFQGWQSSESSISTPSSLEKKINQQKQANKNLVSVLLYKPTYMLPFYYTGTPYQQIYNGNTPNNQKVMNEEFKSQLSFQVPVIPHLCTPNQSLNIAYTQLNYWQVYADSQYFRENNYEPELFYQNHFRENWLLLLGIDHQSNGRGGDLERSWNRAYSELEYSGGNWLVGIRAWDLIFKNESANLHNPQIAHYLGYENILLGYKFHDLVFSIQAQNIESGFKRGFIEPTISYPVYKHIYAYVQYFNGFGQSLIEYNHRTQSIGVGIALNDWM